MLVSEAVGQVKTLCVSPKLSPEKPQDMTTDPLNPTPTGLAGAPFRAHRRSGEIVMHATHQMQQLFCQRIRNSTGLAIFAGLAVLAIVTVGQQPNGEIQREKMPERAEEDDQTQKNADFTGSQRSALETELKKAQEKAQLAQKMVDLAGSQRSALETELKNAEDRAQLAEKMADLAASQRSALETELKNAEDRAQLAEKNADLATSQRTGLEAELKKAQEKVQLAQKIADLVAGQFHAEESRLPNGEPPQKSANLSANQPKSGQTQPPDAGPEPEPVPSTQPVDSSVQSAETTASVPAAAEENKGIGSAEATAPIAVEASPTPKNEPVTREQQPVKSAVPLPTPSVAASMQSAPPEAQTNRSVQTSVEEPSLKEFVLEYIRTAASDDVATQERFFEHNVNYYGEGVISLQRVKASLEHYHREWPIRNWEPQGEPEFPKTLHSANPKLYEVLQPFTWTISNGLRHEQGSATLYVRIWKNDKSEFHIVHVEQRNPHPQSQNN
jgi:hypothetical protein